MEEQTLRGKWLQVREVGNQDAVKKTQMCLFRSGQLSRVGRRVCLKLQCKVEAGLPTTCELP